MPFPIRLGWGIGSLGVAILFNSYAVLLLYYLTNVVGMKVQLAGLLLGIAKAYNVVCDIPIGVVSDHTRSRWGRRRPWMLAASFLCAAAFVILFNVPQSAASAPGATTTYVLGRAGLLRHGLQLLQRAVHGDAGRNVRAATTSARRSCRFAWCSYSSAT